MRGSARRTKSIAIAIVASLALVGATAPAANAAFGLTVNEAAPASTAAGANSDFTVDFDIQDPSADIKDLTVHLPPGLVGNPLATATCTEAQLNANSCPAASVVGTASNDVTVNALVPVPLTASGNVYNVAPRAGEPARFGIVLVADLPVAGQAVPPIILQLPASLRAGDFGLDTNLNDIPNSVQIPVLGATDIDVKSVQLTFNGQVGTPPKGFLRNPTSCGTNTVGFDATAYDGESASAQGTFDTVDCAALPFDPKLSATITRVGSASNPVKLSTTISQTATEAGLKTATVILPAQVAASSSVLTKTCPEADFQAGTCPADTIVGTARAESPLQAQALTGDVAIVAPPSTVGGLPLLGVDLHGALALKLKGAISLDQGPPLRSTVTFDGLPDIPISAFTLTFKGGEGGLSSIICSKPVPTEVTFNTAFTAFSGATAAPTATTPVDCKKGNGNGARPSAKVKLAGLQSGEPRLRLDLKAGSKRIRSTKLLLPKSLAFGTGQTFKRGSKVKADGMKVKVPALKHGRRSLTLKSKGAGVKRIKGSFSNGAVLAKQMLRSKSKARFNISVRDVDGKLTRLTIRSK